MQELWQVTPVELEFMFIVTLGGIFILSTLIGILSSAIDEKLQELRKGRSFVVEKPSINFRLEFKSVLNY